MATVNFIKYQRQSAGALSRVSAYVKQEQKTEGQRLVSCRAANYGGEERRNKPKAETAQRGEAAGQEGENGKIEGEGGAAHNEDTGQRGKHIGRGREKNGRGRVE